MNVDWRSIILISKARNYSVLPRTAEILQSGENELRQKVSGQKATREHALLHLSLQSNSTSFA